MNNNHFVSGVLKDEDDERDYNAEVMYASVGAEGFPKTLDLRDDLPSVRDQGSRGTCAAQTACMIKAWQEKTDSGFDEQMSAEFVYFHRSNKPRAGMYSRDVMHILSEFGCCPEHELPYADSDDDAPKKISKKVLASAANHCIASYARITTIDGLKTALYQDGPCYISFPVYDEEPEFWRQRSPKSERRGGHAVTVVGYNKHGFILRNSWGDDWNGDGHVVYPYSDFGMHWDIWTSIDIRGSPKPPPDPSPESRCCNVL